MVIIIIVFAALIMSSSSTQDKDEDDPLRKMSFFESQVNSFVSDLLLRWFFFFFIFILFLPPFYFIHHLQCFHLLFFQIYWDICICLFNHILHVRQEISHQSQALCYIFPQQFEEYTKFVLNDVLPRCFVAPWPEVGACHCPKALVLDSNKSLSQDNEPKNKSFCFW